MKRFFLWKTTAYLTVEAALVMTMVLSAIVVLIYIMFFQYNRCLLEQDIGSLTLKGCSLQAENKEELLQELKEYEEQLYWDKYIAWKPGKVRMELKQDSIKVGQTGSVVFPFAGENVFNLDSDWKTEAVYENKRISPVTFLRNYNKLAGGK